MLKKLLLVYFLTIGFHLFSQKISVLDKSTLKPITLIQLNSKQHSFIEYTNEKGEFEIDIIDDQFYSFYALGYDTLEILGETIRKQNFKILLIPLKEELNEVVVSNTKWKQSKKRISKKVVSIPKKTIFFNTPQTSADAIEKTGKVFVQKSQQGGGSPFVRGFSTNRILISVDGVRMNTAIFRRGNLQNVISIDPLALQSTEIIFGPGSVVYGSDAIGGTLNFKTLKAKTLSDSEKNVSGNAYYRFSSANLENTVHADINLAHKKWGSVTSFSFNSFDDLIQGNNGPKDFLRNEYVGQKNGEDVILKNENPNQQIPSGFKQYHFLQKIKYQPTEELALQSQLIYSTTSNFSRYDKLFEKKEDQLKNSEWFYGPQKWLMNLNSISFTKRTFLFDKFKLLNSFQFFEESRNVRSFNAPLLEHNKERVNVFSLNIDAQKKLNKFKLNYGFEYVDNIVKSSAQNLDKNTNTIIKNLSTRYPNGSTWKSIAAYSVLNFKINRKFFASGGIRYNQVLINADFDIPELEFPFKNVHANINALTWSLGGVYQTDSGFNIKANFDTAFRAPNIDDLGRIFTGSQQENVLVVPNPNLKSEYAYNFSLGTAYEKNDYKFGITGFQTFLEDALSEGNFSLNGEDNIMFRGQNSRIVATQNSNSLQVYGLEIEGNLPITKKINLSASYTLTKGEETVENEDKVPVRHVPPSFGNVHLVYKTKKWVVDAFTNYHGQLSFENLSPSERAKPGLYAVDNLGRPFSASWYTLNLRGNYTINNKWQLNTTIENITNQRYRTYSSGISAPGINFVASVLYKF